jgi:hypothetical protein
MMAAEGRLEGNRFEGHYSPSRKFADINDRKRKGSLRLLAWSDALALRDRMDAILWNYGGSPEKLKPYDVKYPEKGSTNKIVGLNYEDTRELRDLAEAFIAILQPNI